MAVTITGNTFIGNSPKGAGGFGCTAYYPYGTLTATSNIFNGNSGLSSGGIYCTGGATLSGNIFTGNSATSGITPSVLAGRFLFWWGSIYQQHLHRQFCQRKWRRRLLLRHALTFSATRFIRTLQQPAAESMLQVKQSTYSTI